MMTFDDAALTAERPEAIRTPQVEAAKQSLQDNGMAIIQGVLSADEVAAIRQALEEVIEKDRAAGVRMQGFAADRDALNVRVVLLPAKHARFRELAENPTALALVEDILGDRIHLTSLTANITAPGSAKMLMHCDQGYIPSPWPPFPLGLNVGYALDDFTVENGATLFVPGSHRELHAPDPEVNLPNVTPILCPAGSMLVMEDRLWHQTGANVTADQTRIGLFAHYTRSFLNPQENWRTSMSPELQASLTPSQRFIFGLDSHPARLVHSPHRGA